MDSHRVWIQKILAEAKQKNFKIVQGGEVFEVALNFLGSNSPSSPDGQASSAEPVGYTVSITYKAAPDNLLFQGTYPSEEQALQVMDDLSLACANVEALIRKEKLPEAEKATQELLKKFKSNSGQLPTEEK